MSDFTMGMVSLLVLCGAACLLGGLAVMLAAEGGRDVVADVLQLQLGGVLMVGGFVALCAAAVASVIGARQ